MHNSGINWVIVAVLYCYYGLTIGVKLHVLGYAVRKQFILFSSRRFIVLTVRFMHTVAHVKSCF